MLDQRMNVTVWKVPPSKYLAKMLTELKDVTMQERYMLYTHKRAKLMARRIRELATLHERL